MPLLSARAFCVSGWAILLYTSSLLLLKNNPTLSNQNPDWEKFAPSLLLVGFDCHTERERCPRFLRVFESCIKGVLLVCLVRTHSETGESEMSHTQKSRKRKTRTKNQETTSLAAATEEEDPSPRGHRTRKRSKRVKRITPKAPSLFSESFEILDQELAMSPTTSEVEREEDADDVTRQRVSSSWREASEILMANSDEDEQELERELSSSLYTASLRNSRDQSLRFLDRMRPVVDDSADTVEATATVFTVSPQSVGMTAANDQYFNLKLQLSILKQELLETQALNHKQCLEEIHSCFRELLNSRIHSHHHIRRSHHHHAETSPEPDATCRSSSSTILMGSGAASGTSSSGVAMLSSHLSPSPSDIIRAHQDCIETNEALERLQEQEQTLLRHNNNNNGRKHKSRRHRHSRSLFAYLKSHAQSSDDPSTTSKMVEIISNNNKHAQ